MLINDWMHISIFIFFLVYVSIGKGSDFTGTEIPMSSTCGSPVVADWVAEMSAYLKSLGPKQLVAVGDQGSINPAYGYTGDEIAAIPTIDVVTIHFYPKSWGMPDYENWFKTNADFAHNNGKPIIIEEYFPELDFEISTIETWHRSLESLGYAGSLVWSMQALTPTENLPAYLYSVFNTELIAALDTHRTALLGANTINMVNDVNVNINQTGGNDLISDVNIDNDLGVNINQTGGSDLTSNVNIDNGLGVNINQTGGSDMISDVNIDNDLGVNINQSESNNGDFIGQNNVGVDSVIGPAIVESGLTTF